MLTEEQKPMKTRVKRKIVGTVYGYIHWFNPKGLGQKSRCSPIQCARAARKILRGAKLQKHPLLVN